MCAASAIAAATAAATKATTVTVIPAAAPAATIAVTTIITATSDGRTSWELHISGFFTSLRVLVTVHLHCGYL